MVCGATRTASKPLSTGQMALQIPIYVPQNDTERVVLHAVNLNLNDCRGNHTKIKRVKTITDHVRHDLSAATRR